jgi:Viral coat protein (S domain)
MSTRTRRAGQKRAIAAYYASKGGKNVLRGHGAYNHPGEYTYRKGTRSYGAYVPPGYQERPAYPKGSRPSPPRPGLGDMLAPVGTVLRAGVNALGRVMGFGDYRVSKNSLVIQDPKGMDPPMVKNIQKGEGFTVRHREYLQDIYSSSSSNATGSNFNLQSFDIQPGSVEAFPWLSQIAADFQEYEVNGMVFEFKSLSADAVVGSNNSGALGSVIMATNYNAAAPNYGNKQDMLESEYSTDGKPSCSLMHPVECKRSLTPVSRLYVRTGSVPTGQDQRLFDLGNFQIATQGMQANSAVQGELWVSYEITFYKPILQGVASGNDLLIDKFQLSAVAAATPLGTSQTLVTGSMIGGAINGVTGTTYTFPTWVLQGFFMIVYHVYGTSSTSLTLPSLSASSGTNLKAIWCTSSGFDLAGTASAPSSGTTTVNFNIVVVYQIGPTAVIPAVITFGTGGTYPAGTTYADLVVTEINSSILS